MSKALVLESHRKLFRDERSYEEFVNALKTAAKAGLAVVLSGDQLIGAVLSPESTKEVLTERMLKSMSDRPELLADLTHRIESDKIVDYQPPDSCDK